MSNTSWIQAGRPLLVLLLLLSLGGSSAAAAQDPEPQDAGEAQPLRSEREEYVEVNLTGLPTANTIAAKLPVPLQLTPASVGAVTGVLLREQGATVLGDALRNVSGLNVQPGDGGVFDFFVLRGFDSLSSSLVMTDGASEPEVTFYPLYNVEGVEVLKAPSGFLYGPNPLAGVVNIVRKQPLATEFARLSTSVGSFGTFEGALDWNTATADGDVSFRLNGFWNRSEHYRDDKDSKHFALNPSLAWQLGERSKLNLNLEYVDSAYSPDAGIPLVNGVTIPDVPRRRSYQSPLDFSDQVLYRVQLDYETKLSERVALRNKSYYRDLDWQSNGTIFNGVVFGQVLRTLTTLDDRQRVSGNQFEAIFTLSGGAVEHRLLAGLELATHRDDFAIGILPPPDPFNPLLPSMPPIDLLNPVETLSGPLVTLPFQAGEAKSTIVAPYVIDQMKLSPKFQLLMGARYDRIDFKDDLNGIDRNDSKLSPMLGVTFAPHDALSVYVNTGKSFAPASPRAIGEFEPEESRQVELGVKQRFRDGQLRTSYAVYQVDRDNIGITDANGFTQQIGDQRSRGFEFELAAELPSRIRAFLAYAYNDAELTRFGERVFDPGAGQFVSVDRSGNTSAFAPQQLGSFWVSKTFNRFGVAGGGRYVGTQFIDEDNVFEIDAAVLLDASVFWDWKDCRLKLTLKNLSDAEYETRGFGANSVIPGDGISLHAGFDYRF